MGKIYGTMDDLRLENPRVQQKYIAMTKALIASTDVDGFRVDTPMQVRAGRCLQFERPPPDGMLSQAPPLAVGLGPSAGGQRASRGRGVCDAPAWSLTFSCRRRSLSLESA